MKRTLFASIAAAACALSTLTPVPAWALKEINVRESDTVIVPISLRDQTRIKVSAGRVVEVFGDVYDEEKNATGRISVIQDDDGDLYVKPILHTASLPAASGGRPANAPIKLDIKSTQGSFGLLLQPLDSPGETVDVRIQGGTPRVTPQDARQKSASYVRNVKAFTLAMANPGGSGAMQGLAMREVAREIALWREAKFVLQRTYTGVGLVGDAYELTNVSGARMVIDEREFFATGVMAVSARHLILEPGQTTSVWIVRAATGE